MTQQPADFLERKLSEGATHITLSVALPDGAQTLLDRYPATLGYRELLDRIEDRAHRHASLGPTVALFVVEAVDDARKESLGREVFRVTANPPGSRMMVTEPANDVGLLSQLMRHNEANQRTMLGSVTSLLEHMRGQLEDARRRDDDALSARIRMMEVTEAMISQQSERKLAADEHQARLQLKREGFEKLLTTGQTLASAVMASKGGPVGEDMAGAMSILRMFETLDQEQMMTLLRALRPDQQALVMQFVTKMAEKKAKADGDDSTTH